MTKVAVQLSGVISMAKVFGVSSTDVVKSDSSSAIGIGPRGGLGGRCRHVKVHYLQIQSKVKDGDLKLQKVFGTNCVADAMTKAADRWALDKYMAAMSLHSDARSRGQSTSRSTVWRIFMNGPRVMPPCRQANPASAQRCVKHTFKRTPRKTMSEGKLSRGPNGACFARSRVKATVRPVLWCSSLSFLCSFTSQYALLEVVTFGSTLKKTIPSVELLPPITSVD